MSVRPLYVREGVEPEAWDAFVARSPDALLFHANDWLEVLRDTQGAPLVRYGLYTEPGGGELAGVVPVFIGRFGIIHVAGSPLVLADTPYLGPTVPDSMLPEAAAALRARVRRKASFLRLVLPYAVSDATRARLEAAGFTIATKSTHRIDLTIGVDAMWDQLKGTCRTAVRRARKSGIEIEHVPDPTEEIVGRYFSLVQGVYGRQGRTTPQPLEFYRQLCSRIGPRGLLSFMMARLDGKDVAGALFAHDDRRVYYLDGASDYDYANMRPSNLVLWSGAEWAAQTGRVEFDFVGSDVPRLARFKATFGGQLVEHSSIEWASSKAIAAARRWYALQGRPMLSGLKRRFEIALGRGGGADDGARGESAETE